MRTIIYGILGALLGLLLVRLLLLDSIEVMGWDAFWRGLAGGPAMNPARVAQSSTFLKSVVGTALGATAGMITAHLVSKHAGDRDAGST